MSAMIAIIIKEKLYDATFIEQHTQGFDDVKQYLAMCRLKTILPKLMYLLI